jgi:hypothetical protein
MFCLDQPPINFICKGMKRYFVSLTVSLTHTRTISRTSPHPFLPLNNPHPISILLQSTKSNSPQTPAHSTRPHPRPSTRPDATKPSTPNYPRPTTALLQAKYPRRTRHAAATARRVQCTLSTSPRDPARSLSAIRYR